MIYAWHFTGDKLRDGTKIPQIGNWLRHGGEIKMCYTGLHASRLPMDALMYAPYKKNIKLHRVACRGDVKEDSDKLVCRERKILWTIEMDPMLHAFARWCALQVIDKWETPKVVIDFLLTGDPTLRSAAADSAARSAYSAAFSAAFSAAYSAARSAVYSAYSAARSVARSAQNEAFLEFTKEVREGYIEWEFTL